MKTKEFLLMTMMCLLSATVIRAEGPLPAKNPLGWPSDPLSGNNPWSTMNSKIGDLGYIRPLPAAMPSARGFGDSFKAGMVAPLGLAGQLYSNGLIGGCQEFWKDNWGSRTSDDCLGFLLGCAICATMVQAARKNFS